MILVLCVSALCTLKAATSDSISKSYILPELLYMQQTIKLLEGLLTPKFN